MRTAFVIATNHLKRLARKPGLILLLGLIPLTLAVIQWAAFGRTAASGQLPAIKLLVLDQDGTMASGLLLSAFDQEQLSDAFAAEKVASREAARKAFKRQSAAALVIVPEGFQQALLAGEPTELVLVRNPLQVYSPQAAEAVMRMLATLGNGVLQLAREPLKDLEPFLDGGEGPTPGQVGLIATGLYQAVEKLMERAPFESAKLVVAREDAEPGSPQALLGDTQGFFGTVFPGLVLFTLLFIAEALARRLLRDRTQGLGRRLAMGPASHAAVLAGGALYVIAGLLVMLALLGLVGWLVFRIQLRDPLTLVLLGVGFAAFAAGLQLLVMGLMRTERGASAVGGIVIILLALAGGTFLPLDTYPAPLKAVATYTPNGAAHQGMVDVLVRRQPRRKLAGRIALVWNLGSGRAGCRARRGATQARGMKVLAIALNDIRRILRDRQALFWLFVGPVIFVTFFGFLFRDVGPGRPLLRVLDQENDGYLARALASVLEEDGIVVRAVDSVQPGRLTLVVPEDATRRLAAGGPVELTLRAPSELSPAEQGLSFSIQRALVSIVLQAHPADVPHDLRADAIRERLAANTIIHIVEQAGEGVAPNLPPAGFRHSVPAYLVMFLLMNLLSSGADIAAERQAGQLRRIAMAPVPHLHIVLGKLLGRFTLGWLLMLWLLGLGFLVFRIGWLEHPWALVGFLTVFAFAAASAGLLIGTLVRDPDKAGAAAIWAVILLSPLGGLWWPLEVVGPTLRRIGTLVPTGWAMQAVSAAINFGAGPLELAPWAAAFAVLGVVCLLVASHRLRPAG